MKIEDIAKELNLRIFGGTAGLSGEAIGGYTSDLLSDVMGFAVHQQVWITLQTHKNVLAVASLKDLAAIILVKGFEPDEDMLIQANEEGIPVLGTSDSAFIISGKLYNLLTK
jgi:predicted transcriptional regulator